MDGWMDDDDDDDDEWRIIIRVYPTVSSISVCPLVFVPPLLTSE